MQIETMMDAIDETMYWTDSTAVDRAHIACAYHLFALALWLRGRTGHDAECKAVVMLAYRALADAPRYHTEIILGIAQYWESI